MALGSDVLPWGIRTRPRALARAFTVLPRFLLRLRLGLGVGSVNIDTQHLEAGAKVDIPYTVADFLCVILHPT